jgi:hypothetical protein
VENTVWVALVVSGSTLVIRSVVQGADDERRDRPARHLGRDVAGDLAPREPVAHRQRHRDRRVEMGAGEPGSDVAGHRDADAPRPGDGVVATHAARRDGRPDLGLDAQPEQHQEQGARELGAELSG